MAEIQFDDGATAFTDERWAGMTEAGFYPFEAECLYSVTVGEFHHIVGEPHIGQLRVAQADIWRGICFVVAGDFQVIDID